MKVKSEEYTNEWNKDNLLIKLLQFNTHTDMGLEDSQELFGGVVVVEGGGGGGGEGNRRIK